MKLSNKIIDRYKISISGLPIGVSEHKFILDDLLFEYFNHPYVEKGRIDVQLRIDKRPNVIEVQIHLKGDLEVTCDRCLDKFIYPIEVQDTLTYSIEEDKSNHSGNIVVIPKEQSEIDLSSELYEMSLTALPISKIHPKDKDGQPTCNVEMIEILEKYLVKE